MVATVVGWLKDSSTSSITRSPKLMIILTLLRTESARIPLLSRSMPFPSTLKSKGDCNSLNAALTNGPISVAVDATNFQFYSQGIFKNCKANLNHGVLLVANTDSALKIKNSWSAAWGEAGFIRLAPGNTCGVCDAASYPIV